MAIDSQASSVSVPPLGILVSAPVVASDGARLLQACLDAGHPAELLVLDHNRPLSPAEAARIHCALLSMDVMGNSSKTALEPALAGFYETLRHAPNLRWLQVCSAGMDRDIYSELHARGVRLTTGAGSNGQAVAQTAIAGVLALARGLPHWVATQREHRWVPLRGPLTPLALEGQHAVVVGMGSIGCNIARLLQALELSVTGVRRTPAPEQYFDEVVGMDALDALLPQADWLVLVCPLTDSTRHLLNARRLALMRPHARVINVARGEVIDEAALVEALQRQAIAGAYLDVFSIEPLAADSPLWELPNVLLSPHSAGNSTSHQRNVIELFHRNLQCLVAGEPLVNTWRPS